MGERGRKGEGGREREGGRKGGKHKKEEREGGTEEGIEKSMTAAIGRFARPGPHLPLTEADKRGSSPKIWLRM